MNDMPRFDAADYLATPEARADYMAAALEEGDASEIRRALNTVARSLGMTAVAEEAGLDVRASTRHSATTAIRNS